MHVIITAYLKKFPTARKQYITSYIHIIAYLKKHGSKEDTNKIPILIIIAY